MKIVCYGSANVAGTGLQDRSMRFTSQISRLLSCQEINLGLDGSLVVGRNDQGMLISDTSAIARVPDVIDSLADRVIVLYGDNDWSKGTVPGEETLFKQGTFLWDFDTMVRGLLDAFEAEQILLVTLPAALYTLLNAKGYSVTDYNNCIRGVAARYSVPLVDAEQDLDTVLVDHDFSVPGVLSARGHIRLAEELITRLKVDLPD